MKLWKNAVLRLTQEIQFPARNNETRVISRI